MIRLRGARPGREAATGGHEFSVPPVVGAIALGGMAGALLSALPRLVWRFFGQQMARPAEFGWIRLIVSALERRALVQQLPGDDLRLPSDLMELEDLTRLIATVALGNSLLALAAALLVLLPAALMLRNFTSIVVPRSALASCALTLAAAPEYLPPCTAFVFRKLLPEAPWAVAATVALAAILGAFLAVWLGAFLLLRPAGQAWGHKALRRLAAVAVVGALGLTSGVLWHRRPTLPAPVLRETLSTRPNILLISIDSLRPDHLRSYGYARRTSPNIDRLAEEGVRFETALAPTPWTLPSHVTLLTGLPPESHGVIYDRMRLAPAAITLPEVLRASGYRTAALVSAPYLDASYGYYKGFDYYDDFTVRAAHGGGRAASSEAELWVTSQVLAEGSARILLDWRRDQSEQPLFLFVHMWDVHYDYIPSVTYDRFLDPGYEGPVTGDFDEITAELGPDDLARVLSLYDGEIRLVDEFVGRIVSSMRDLGLLDETVIVVTADHGEEFFEHGRAGHRNNLYDTTLRVPLVIRYPRRIPAQSVVRRQARLMDVGSTILSLAGIERPAGFAEFEGEPEELPIDLTRYLGEPDAADSSTFAFGDLHGIIASVRTEEFKLITYLEGSKGDELYRLGDDPGERVNLIVQEPEVARRLKARLLRWRSRQGITSFAKEISISEQHQRELRALGYLE